MSQTPSNPAPRVPLNMPIFFKKNYARHSEAGSLYNISITGAFLQSNVGELAPQDKITLYFEVSGRKRKINAHIIWKNDLGAGICFAPFNNRDVQIIDDLIYFVENTRDSRREVLDSIFKKVS